MRMLGHPCRNPKSLILAGMAINGVRFTAMSAEITAAIAQPSTLWPDQHAILAEKKLWNARR